MTSEIVLKIKFKNAHGLIKLHTLQIKYYNELHWSQKSEWDMDKVTVFYVGTFFEYTLALSMSIYKKKISAEISGKNA